MFPLNPNPLLRLNGLDPLTPMANGGGGLVGGLFGGGGGDVHYPAPDYRIGQASQLSAETSARALDWYMSIYNQDAPYRNEVRDLSMQLANAQLDAQQQNQAIANDYYSYMTNTFRPVEAGIVNKALTYSTEAETERMASQAAADVSAAGANQRTQLARSLAAMGVNPSSPRYIAMMQDQSIMEAASRAGAMTQARQTADQQSWARQMDAASLGRNLPANQATSQGIAITAGNSALNAAQVPGQQAALYGTMAGQGFNTALQGYNQMGSILNNQYSTQMQGAMAESQLSAQNAQAQSQAIGAIAGAAATYFMMGSSKDIKTKKRPVSAALEGLRDVPVEKWQYKKGEGDGGEHIGPYAEDVQKNFGDKVAPGGKMIDMISMIGINTAAIKELDKKVSKLEKRG